jgi:DNA-binding NarL/FixJ family response regulator
MWRLPLQRASAGCYAEQWLIVGHMSDVKPDGSKSRRDTYVNSRKSLAIARADPLVSRALPRGRAAMSIEMAQIPKLQMLRGISKARVLIVDDQPVVRDKVAELISGEHDLAVCGATDDARAALEIIAAAKPALIVTGLALKDGHGLEFVKDVHARHPSVAVLVFSIYDEVLYAERAIRAGARGFLSKRAPTKELLRAIRCVLGGEIYVSERIAAHSIRHFFARPHRASASDLEQLSDRELEVFELIGQGRSSREIAAALHLDVKTIETYRSRIKAKLDLTTATELVQRAQQSVQYAVSTRARSERRV